MLLSELVLWILIMVGWLIAVLVVNWLDVIRNGWKFPDDDRRNTRRTGGR